MDSAPSIRAYNMYHALKVCADINVTLVSPPIWDSVALKAIGSKIKGWDFLFSIYGRMLSEMIHWIKKNEIYVYIESLATSLHNFDYIFLNALKKKNIPIFPYIRDLYWKYEGTLKPEKKWFKYSQMEYDWYLKNATALLFPSKLMADTVDFTGKYVLPPAGDVSRCLSQEIPANKNITFISGLSPGIGIDILIKAMEIVVKEHPDAHCTIVGRGDQEIIDKWKDEDYVTFVTDKTYKDIPDILSNTYATVIPHPRTPYNDFAMSFKIFDYMSSGRPIVATNCTAQANFIKENDVGIITDDTPETIKNNHSWDHRAKELIIIMEKYLY
jgi:glycosyltransferase involved in cell wall biosynthesis